MGNCPTCTIRSVFDPVANKGDQEAMERFLEPEDRRQQFYDALNAFAKGLKVALGVVEFYQNTPEAKIRKYKEDLRNFHHLRTSVKLRYAESVDYGEYEQKIRKLLNDHISAEGVSVLTPEVNIFDEPAFEAAVAHLTSPAARADAIAYRLKKTATEKMDEDPAFYRKFSQLVEETIEAYKQGRITELEYLDQVEAQREQLTSGVDSSLPAQLANTRDAAAYYDLLLEQLGRYSPDGDTAFASSVADLAISIEASINRLKVRDWVHNPDRINRMKDALDDHLSAFPVKWQDDDLKAMLEIVVETAKKRDSL